MLSTISAELKQELYTAIEGDDTGTFKATCIFSNPETEYEFVADYVGAGCIVQDFRNSYMDIMQITIPIEPSELRKFLANTKGMMCTLNFTPMDATNNQTNYDKDEIQMEMMVYLNDQPDIDKILNSAQFGSKETKDFLTPAQKEARTEYTVNLISKKMHDARFIGINTILRDATVKDALYYICQQFKFDNVEIVEPDNKQSYGALIIPPVKYIDDVFTYLQSRYGVYSKDIGYYYTDDTMYIYPLYDSDPNTSPVTGNIHITNVPQGEYGGLACYYNEYQGDYYIASNTATTMRTMNTRGAENVGTSFTTINSDQFLDQDITIGSDGKVSKAQNQTIIEAGNSDRNLNDSMQNAKYAGPSTNIFASTSKLARYNGTELGTGWVRARPGILKPGHSIIYGYDGADGTFLTQKGRLMGVIYTFDLMSSDSAIPWVTMNATMQVFLEPELTDVPTELDPEE